MSLRFARSMAAQRRPVASFRHSALAGSPQRITFAPLAWLKLQHFLQADAVEIAGFGISAADDLLYVESFRTVRQQASFAHVQLDDQAVADHFDTCIDDGLLPRQCGRIWIHTHPGNCPLPSTTDEHTFTRVFGACDWAAMVIVARDGSSYGRLQFTAGPGGQVVVPVGVDWARLPHDLLAGEGTLDAVISGWSDEYGRNIYPTDTRHPEDRLDEPVDDLADDLAGLADWAEAVYRHEQAFDRDLLAASTTLTSYWED